MNPKPIAIFAPEIHPPFIEGVQKTAWVLIREFLQQRKEVIVFTEQSFGTRDMPLDPLLRVYYWFTVSKFKLYKYIVWMHDGVQILRELNKQHITQVYVFSLDLPFFFTLAWIFLCGRHIQVVLTIFSPREIGFLGNYFFKFFKHKFFHYVVRSEYLKKRLISKGISPNKITVLLPFPNKQLFVTPAPEVNKKPRTVAYLSNAEAVAGVYDILALAKLFPEYKFIIAIRKFSEDEEMEVKKIEQKIVEEKLSNITVERTIADMVNFLQTVETVVLPVNDENASMDMPMVLIEALASKTTVIVRSLPLFNELVKYNYVFSFKTIAELRQLIELPSITKEEYSKRGYNWVLSLPNEVRAAQIYQELFN